jgi:hypothetical protein
LQASLQNKFIYRHALRYRRKPALMCPMTKKQALKLFGGLKPMAEALGISRQAIDQWPDKLTTKQADWVSGAALRLGLFKR